jgi:spermidine/putrescine transport system ATP-binding protein
VALPMVRNRGHEPLLAAGPVAVECSNLSKSFDAGAVRALDGVSITIRANEFFTLLGPSGCGKTTLLRLIAGFEDQDTGSVVVYGRKLDGLPPFRRPVNTVFQSYAVFPHMTVRENIAFGLRMQRRPSTEIDRRVREMVALVRPQGLEDRRPSQLSGGQQQRVALARALATEPRVLLLDEPLSALDLKLRMGMQLELKKLQAEVGITFIFVTHDQHEALTMSDRIAVMDRGRILQMGTPEDVYERPVNRFVADFIGDTNLLDAQRISPGRFRLPSGEEIEAQGDAGNALSVVLAIRPERVRLSTAGDGLRGVVEQVIYQGTDTIYHALLGGDVRIRARRQNAGDSGTRPQPGDGVRILLPPSAVRMLAE